MFLLKISPAGQGKRRHCERTIGLSPAGKPISCNSRSYVCVDPPDGLAVCKRHFDESKPGWEKVCLEQAHKQQLARAKG